MQKGNLLFPENADAAEESVVLVLEDEHLHGVLVCPGQDLHRVDQLQGPDVGEDDSDCL